MKERITQLVQKYRRFWPALPAILLFGWMCSGSTPESQAEHEWFVFVSQSSVRSREVYLQVLTKEAAPQDVVHLVHNQSLVSTVMVPRGSEQSRLRNPKVKSQLPAIQKFFAGDIAVSDADADNQLGLYEIPTTIRSLRQTELPCRILLVGSPIYHDEIRHAGWSMMEGVVPSDSALHLETSPFHGDSGFPNATEISWLVPTQHWGVDQAHREAVTRFQRLFVQERGGSLVRLTADPQSALNFGMSQFDGEVKPIPGQPRMIQASFESVRVQPKRPAPAPIEVPITHREAPKLASPSDAANILTDERGLEDLLGSDAEIECLFLLDTSGSMMDVRNRLNQILLDLAVAIPKTSARVRVGMICYCNGGLAALPLQQLQLAEVDSGVSFDRLKRFITTASVSGHGSGANVDTAVAKAIEMFEASEKPQSRQVLVLLGDTGLEERINAVNLQAAEDQLVRQVGGFLQSASHERRVYTFFNGLPTAKAGLFRRLGSLTPKCTFSTDPNGLLLGVLRSLAAGT